MDESLFPFALALKRPFKLPHKSEIASMYSVLWAFCSLGKSKSWIEKLPTGLLYLVVLYCCM